MNQKKKNIGLIILIVLLTASAVILYFAGGPSTRVNFDATKFTVQDTAAITKITISGNSVNNTLEEINGTWWVNNKYLLDPSMKKVLMAVLYNVRIHRTAPKNQVTAIKKELDNSGYKVSIYGNDNLIESFTAGGNNISISYFMNDDADPYVVHLPGYDSYVTGIFQVSENDWRDRLVFSTSWMGLKKLAMEYPGKKQDDFTITSGKNLPVVEGIARPDTTNLMQYVEMFQTFAVDQYLDSGRVAKYDSLAMTRPWAVLTVDAISLTRPCTIEFFPRLNGDRLMVGKLQGNQIVLFSYDRIKEIFKSHSYFGK